MRYELRKGCGELPAFASPLADSSRFPKAEIRAAPSLVARNAFQPSTLHRQELNALRVDHARTGIYLIARLLAPRRVWIPAYHCPAMVEPFVALGCEVAFYPIEGTLEPNLEFLDTHVRCNDALVGVRFFGFDTGIRELAAFCCAKGVVLIEDLAHAAFFDGMVGSFGVTSLVKFLPITVGGELLMSANAKDAQRLSSLYLDLPTPLFAKMRALIKKLAKRFRVGGSDKTCYRYFQSDRMHRAFTRYDEIILNNADFPAIRRKRRENYHYLASALSDSARGVVLFQSLPEQVVPYMLPFLLHTAETFDHLRRDGIQALRWEEMVPTNCEVSALYRERLVQLPIHQDLGRQQMNQIASVLVQR